MDIVVFEHDQEFVLDAFHQGDFDFVDGISEVGGLSNFRTWSSCPIPLNVVVNREHYADGHEEIWMLADTKKVATGDMRNATAGINVSSI
jgi:hypothetical protein